VNWSRFWDTSPNFHRQSLPIKVDKKWHVLTCLNSTSVGGFSYIVHYFFATFGGRFARRTNMDLSGVFMILWKNVIHWLIYDPWGWFCLVDWMFDHVCFVGYKRTHTHTYIYITHIYIIYIYVCIHVDMYINEEDVC
jgi:hypothetical protein